ncbi:MAG TPA: hypothetical protein VJY62_10355 [Bacteroidia bacterium]|nr:hypothetical protein [Bacteroidia bacterium]
MKRKTNLPVLEFCWILFFVLTSVVKIALQQTNLAESAEQKSSVQFQLVDYQSRLNWLQTPYRLCNSTLNGMENK